jgi:hypothetical protein
MVIDAWSRMVVGWSMAGHLRTELLIAALEMALWRRPGVGEGLVFHSDRGTHCTSLAFGRRCREAGIAASMGSVGDAYDNAVAESFFATLETELVDRHSWRTPPTRGWRCSTSSRPSTTRSGGTASSGSYRQPSSRGGIVRSSRMTRRPSPKWSAEAGQLQRVKRRDRVVARQLQGELPDLRGVAQLAAGEVREVDEGIQDVGIPRTVVGRLPAAARAKRKSVAARASAISNRSDHHETRVVEVLGEPSRS